MSIECADTAVAPLLRLQLSRLGFRTVDRPAHYRRGVTRNTVCLADQKTAHRFEKLFAADLKIHCRYRFTHFEPMTGPDNSLALLLPKTIYYRGSDNGAIWAQFKFLSEPAADQMAAVLMENGFSATKHLRDPENPHFQVVLQNVRGGGRSTFESRYGSLINLGPEFNESMRIIGLAAHAPVAFFRDSNTAASYASSLRAAPNAWGSASRHMPAL
jgi:hypothetical protein